MEAAKTGQWIKVSVDPDKVRWMCSFCEKETDLPNYEKVNFCFNCGAKMSLEAKMIKEGYMNNEFVPETLTWCRQHYVPPVKEHIHCPDFGKSDGTNGSCWWCKEMTPYQWHMCSDETWVRGLLSSTARILCKSREEACQFIEGYKQRNPMDNESSV